MSPCDLLLHSILQSGLGSQCHLSLCHLTGKEMQMFSKHTINCYASSTRVQGLRKYNINTTCHNFFNCFFKNVFKNSI